MTSETNGSVRQPAIVAAREDGTVVAQNACARKLMEKGLGRPCWDVVGGLAEANGLPCAQGCVRDLIRDGVERTRHTRITLRGQRHHLTCVPIKNHAVCILDAGASSPPEAWQLLTGRERQVLRLLADGETSPTMALHLGVSESTVRTHVERMRSKLGINTRAGLVALGFRLGFLD
jgi:DNA-binding CsgD family transcriptional regulator